MKNNVRVETSRTCVRDSCGSLIGHRANIIKIAIRGLLGSVVGTVGGGVICALIFALLELFFGGTRSLGGICTIATPVRFSAVIGAIVGAVYGAIIGTTNGPAGLGPVGGTVADTTIGAIIAAWLFFGASDTSVNSALAWIIAIGAILGLTIGYLLRLLLKRIEWLRTS